MTGPTPPAFDSAACWVVSDLHLGPQHPHRMAAFDRLLARAVAAGCPLVCGGDLFELFLGWPGSLMPFQEEIYHKLMEYKEKGLKFYWIEGNRDYRPEFWRDALAGVGRFFIWQVGRQRIGMVHGEHLDRATWPNRIWLRIGKHALVLWAAGRLPGPVVLRIGRALERWLRRSTRKYRRPIPWSRILPHLSDWARREALDLVLLGHYHQWIVSRLDHAPARDLVVLPSWEERPTYFEITASGNRVLRQIDGTEAGIEPVAAEATLAHA